MSDLINHPPHYLFSSKFEVIEVLEEWFPTSPLLWQVGKYIARAGRKGDELTDLKKAKFYLDRYITQKENSNESKPKLNQGCYRAKNGGG